MGDSSMRDRLEPYRTADPKFYGAVATLCAILDSVAAELQRLAEDTRSQSELAPGPIADRLEQIAAALDTVFSNPRASG